jgi:putative sugar O-methyltransferase
MKEFVFTSEFIERYQNFLSSDCFTDIDTHSKSDYWEHHSKLVKVHISGNKITVDGSSGFYIPPEKNRLQSAKKNIKKLIRDPSKLISFIKRKVGYPFSEIKLLNYLDSFDRIMSHDPIVDPDLSPYRINFSKLKEITSVIGSVSEMEIKQGARDKYKLSPSIVTAYYYCNILSGYTDINHTKRILEIGGGNGNLISCLSRFTSNSTIIDVDLPETLSHSILYISELFPKSKILMPNEAKSSDFSNYDFIFITPKQLNLINDNSVDLSINTDSFQEMTQNQIEVYFKLIQRVGKNESLFFTRNRVEKIPCGPDSYEKEVSEIPNRFSEYPWNPDNKTLIYEICKLTRLVQLDNCYLRLEQISK